MSLLHRVPVIGKYFKYEALGVAGAAAYGRSAPAIAALPHQMRTQGAAWYGHPVQHSLLAQFHGQPFFAGNHSAGHAMGAAFARGWQAPMLAAPHRHGRPMVARPGIHWNHANMAGHLQGWRVPQAPVVNHHTAPPLTHPAVLYGPRRPSARTEGNTVWFGDEQPHSAAVGRRPLTGYPATHAAAFGYYAPGAGPMTKAFERNASSFCPY